MGLKEGGLLWALGRNVCEKERVKLYGTNQEGSCPQQGKVDRAAQDTKVGGYQEDRRGKDTQDGSGGKTHLIPQTKRPQRLSCWLCR